MYCVNRFVLSKHTIINVPIVSCGLFGSAPFVIN